MMEFHLFGDFPPEIRVLIWQFAIPENEPEVCIVQPACDTPQSLLVYTAFPVLMHVCHESRQLVQNSRLSGINFISSKSANSTAGCLVPSRRFRPELDTLFCPIGGPAALEDISSQDELESILQETRYLAVSGKKEYINLLAWILLFHFPKLETLSVVVGDMSPDSCFESCFDAPKTRCKLSRISGEPAWSMVRGAKQSVDVGVPGPVHFSDCMGHYTHELEKLMAECVEDMERTIRKSHPWWDNESNAVRKVKYSVQAFVEC
ncbi:uncharacterized protein LY79DRAFT_65100 [Colletotrichum navitas]|uniref:2EXR domain-containing protein n=1 Tax=Colletotrichum navitas TaxID=681940 RepID=A0AAD8V811_9PEZI|nr:uncharacterized protein LY79DRAFT_65100 [Colletotrichum navitas]KAK1596449.1 hypothetical protein LY79DRAFT_65100 [Colletotrichum navitas]